MYEVFFYSGLADEKVIETVSSQEELIGLLQTIHYTDGEIITVKKV